ncbi:phosphatidic acid phosphatase type 2/haloperoxidase [Phaeosphaeriaceae sp. PMI808]|nr:phosphatidic acid phosphatase type 2/haloperoxidase [Phaeosphaeriaceae sp. PMI808]
MDEWTSKQLPERLPFSKKRLPKRVIFSYIIDYLIIVVLIGVFTIIDKIPPFHQPFSLENYTLHYPFATKERVSVPWLCVYVVFAPAVIIGIYTMVIDGLFSHQKDLPTGRAGIKRLSGRYRFKDRLWELNCGILGLGLAVGAAFTITGALKNAIGKPRPDLIDRCLVNLDKIDKTPRKLQTYLICDQTNNYILSDGFKSFPSGHSSVSFAGLFYLSLYLAAKLHVLDAKGEVWRSFVVMVPTLGAALITGTRIMDARHHPFDVISGALLGILVAWASYRQYFPPVSETWRKGRAYPIRAWGRGPAPPPNPNPVIMVDEDVQPLRPMASPMDMERGEASGFASSPAAPGDNEHGSNVFRQQIKDSQRRRNNPYAADRSDTMASSNYRSDTMGSTISTKVSNYQSQMPAASPYAGQRRMDTYDYSSSEDGDGYEMQSGRFTDTGYHRPTGVSPQPTPPPPANMTGPGPQPSAGPTGDLSERRDLAPALAPAPPPHAVGTTPQQI